MRKPAGTSAGAATADELPDQVRRACARVAARARQVAIDADRLAAMADELPDEAALPSPDPRLHFHGGPPEAVISFVLCLDAINFGSGWWPTVRKRPGQSGYLTMAAGLAERFVSRGPWSAGELFDLDAATVATVLGQDPDHELMELYAAALSDLGAHVRDDAGGRFGRLVSDSRGSAVALAGRLASWACFADVCSYDGFEVPFFKRAQLCAADLDAAGVARFDDLRRLTAFADNLVPHVLALDGVLVLDDALAQQIERGELLTHGSTEEVELRACTVHAVELLAEACDRRLSPSQIDSVLWTRGGGARYKARPRPRSRTTAY
ncbi:MAG: queuosine salvage family protein [Solirubrobacteraceae bacterium]